MLVFFGLGPPLFLQSFQDFDFPALEKNIAGQIGNFTAQQDHQLDAPSQNHINGDGPLETLGGLVLMFLHLAAAFENPVPFLNAPSPTVEAHEARGLLGRLHLLGRQ
jgi:hypothetical protein